MDIVSWLGEEPSLMPHQPSCHPDSGCVFCSPSLYPVSMGSSMYDTLGAMSLPDYLDADAYSPFSQPEATFLDASQPEATFLDASHPTRSWNFTTTEPAFPLPGLNGTSTSTPQWQQALQNEPGITIYPSLVNTWSAGPVPIRLANPNSAAVANFSPIQNLQPTAHESEYDYISSLTNLPIPLQPFPAENLNSVAYTTPHSSQDILGRDIFNQGIIDQGVFNQDSNNTAQFTGRYSQTPQNAFAHDSSRFVPWTDVNHMP